VSGAEPAAARGPADRRADADGPAAGGRAHADGAAAGEPPDGGGARLLDCRGQRCPLPVIALARRLPELALGEVLRVLADDPAAAVDIPAWCRLRGQEYVGPAGRHGYDVRRVV
jgi:tRNA 2-thiouridine synthesizing protein A